MAAGTIRMWEQRYGFPEPGAHRGRLPRLHRAGRRRAAARRRLPRPRALGARPRSSAPRRWRARPTARRSSPRSASGDAPVRPQQLRRPTLIALSRAIEEEAMARAAGPVVIGAFQAERNYRAVEHRYRRLAHVADAVGVFADFAEPRVGDEDEPAEIPIGHGRRARPRVGGGRRRARLRRLPGRLGDAGRAPASGSSRRSGRWTRAVVRRAAQVGAALAARSAPEWSERLLGMLADRPLAVEAPAPGSDRADEPDDRLPRR